MFTSSAPPSLAHLSDYQHSADHPGQIAYHISTTLHCLARFEGVRKRGGQVRSSPSVHIISSSLTAVDRWTNRSGRESVPWNRQLLLLIDPQRVQMCCCSSDIFDKLQCSEYADLSLIFDKLQCSRNANMS